MDNGDPEKLLRELAEYGLNTLPDIVSKDELTEDEYQHIKSIINRSQKRNPIIRFIWRPVILRWRTRIQSITYTVKHFGKKDHA